MSKTKFIVGVLDYGRVVSVVALYPGGCRRAVHFSTGLDCVPSKEVLAAKADEISAAKKALRPHA